MLPNTVEPSLTNTRLYDLLAITTTFFPPKSEKKILVSHFSYLFIILKSLSTRSSRELCCSRRGGVKHENLVLSTFDKSQFTIVVKGWKRATVARALLTERLE